MAGGRLIEGAGEGESRLRDGVKAGIPFGIAGFMLALSFGIVAQSAGLSATAAIVMSAIVFAGSAQFAAIAILASGGTVGAALVAAAMMNSRFLAMGAALGPSLPGGPLRRALQGQAVVDASWALASRGDGSFDRHMLFGSTAVQYVGWVGGTIAGALGGGLLSDPEALGLDAIYPAFFLALLLNEVRNRRAVRGRRRGRADRARARALRSGRPARARRRPRRARRPAPLGPSRPAARGRVSTSVVLIAGCAVMTFAIKAAGPIALGGRELPAWFTGVVVLLAPALLAALIVTQALADGQKLTIGPDTAGVVAGGLVAWRLGSVIGCVLVAAGVTAGLRAI